MNTTTRNSADLAGRILLSTIVLIAMDVPGSMEARHDWLTIPEARRA